MLDKIDKHTDWELATHLVSLYAEDSPFSAGINILVSKENNSSLDIPNSIH